MEKKVFPKRGTDRKVPGKFPFIKKLLSLFDFPFFFRKNSFYLLSKSFFKY